MPTTLTTTTIRTELECERPYAARVQHRKPHQISISLYASRPTENTTCVRRYPFRHEYLCVGVRLAGAVSKISLSSSPSFSSSSEAEIRIHQHRRHSRRRRVAQGTARSKHTHQAYAQPNSDNAQRRPHESPNLPTQPSPSMCLDPTPTDNTSTAAVAAYIFLHRAM